MAVMIIIADINTEQTLSFDKLQNVYIEQVAMSA